MKNPNKNQALGIGIFIVACATPFMVQNNFVETISGVMAAIGLTLILKWIPFRKKRLK